MNRPVTLDRMRHGPVHMTLYVPDGAVLLAWGTTAHQPLVGHVTFFETGGRTARETLAWEAGRYWNADRGAFQ